jgi:hypothetical protein
MKSPLRGEVSQERGRPVRKRGFIEDETLARSPPSAAGNWIDSIVQFVIAKSPRYFDLSHRNTSTKRLTSPFINEISGLGHWPKKEHPAHHWLGGWVARILVSGREAQEAVRQRVNLFLPMASTWGPRPFEFEVSYKRSCRVRNHQFPAESKKIIGPLSGFELPAQSDCPRP